MAIIGSSLRRNDIMALLLIALVSLAPIPLGSNRPSLWAITDTLVFAVFFAQTLMRVFDKDERSRFLPNNRVLLVLFAFIALWHVVQILPLGSILPGPESGIGGYGQTISLVPGQTVLMLLNFLAYGVVFILAFQIGQRPGRAHRLYTWTGYMIGAFGLYALYNYAVGDNALLGFSREFYIKDAAGTFINRNNFATFLGLGLVLNTGLVADAIFGALKEGRRPQVMTALVHAAIGALLLAGLLATHSRMGLFASVIGAVVVLALFAIRSGSGARIKVSGVVLVLIGVAAIALLYGQGVLERLGSSQSSLDVRTDLYAQVLELVSLRPLLGFGAGAFEAAFPLVHHLPVSPDLLWDKAHNTYLALFAELGVPMGFLAIAIIALLIGRFISALKVDGVARLGAAISLGTIVQVGLHSLVDFSLEIHAVALLLAFLLGLGRAVSAGVRK